MVYMEGLTLILLQASLSKAYPLLQRLEFLGFRFDFSFEVTQNCIFVFFILLITDISLNTLKKL